MGNGIPKDEFQKSLSRLETMAKSQLFHTAGDSEPGAWAGTSPQDENEMESMIDINGTDYDGVRKALVVKATNGDKLSRAEKLMLKGFNPLATIGAKINDGKALTKAERWAINGGAKVVKALPLKKSADKPGAAGTPGEEKDAASVPGTHAGEEMPGDEVEADASKAYKGGDMPWDKDHDDDDDDKAKKSLGSAVNSSAVLKKGIEMSPFLYEFIRAIGTALDGTEGRVQKSVAAATAPVISYVQQLEQSLLKHLADQGEFNKSLAEAVVGIGQQLAGNAEVANQSANAPARGPKTSLRAVQGGNGGGVQALQKSFGPGGFDTSAEAMSKSQIVNAMTDMVKGGELSSLDVIKFESTGEISPSVQQKIAAHAGGQRNAR